MAGSALKSRDSRQAAAEPRRQLRRDRRRNLDEMESDFLAAIEIDNLLFHLVIVMSLTAHACHASASFLPFLKMLFEEIKRDVGKYTYLADIANVIANILVHIQKSDPVSDDVFAFFVFIAFHHFGAVHDAMAGRTI